LAPGVAKGLAAVILLSSRYFPMRAGMVQPLAANFNHAPRRQFRHQRAFRGNCTGGNGNGPPWPVSFNAVQCSAIMPLIIDIREQAIGNRQLTITCDNLLLGENGLRQMTGAAAP
jgi:hypothetical protein